MNLIDWDVWFARQQQYNVFREDYSRIWMVYSPSTRLDFDLETAPVASIGPRPWWLGYALDCDHLQSDLHSSDPEETLQTMLGYGIVPGQHFQVHVEKPWVSSRADRDGEYSEDFNWNILRVEAWSAQAAAAMLEFHLRDRFDKQ